jgi:uncharacterized protein (TIGR03067 family)
MEAIRKRAGSFPEIICGFFLIVILAILFHCPVARTQQQLVEDRRAGMRQAIDKQMLRAAWVCVATLKDGRPVDDYVGVRAVIEGDDLIWYFPQSDGSVREQKNKFRIDPSQEPKHFDWWKTDNPQSIDWRIYDIQGDVLRMATNLDGKTRPETFDSARWQFTVQRVQAQPAPKKTAEIPGWGTFIDPDGTCSFRNQDGKLTLTIPAGQYDFWYGEADAARRYNAPRVLQQVEGDFSIQVKVTADWSPKPALPSGRCFYAAGLIVYDSQHQYLRLERCYFIHRRTGTLHCFAAPLYDLNEKRRVAERVAGADYFAGRSTWLRVQRVGQRVGTSISHDGLNWTQKGVLTTVFPNKVKIGVLALNGSASDFVAEFDDLKVSGK